MVQEFLVQAKEEVEGEMAEDLSAGELQEKLKRLESLQELRLCNEDKVTTIERSAESEEVKKVLQKNPDISKERSNLLKGGGTHLTHTHSITYALVTLLLYSLTTLQPHTHTHTHHLHFSHTYHFALLIHPLHSSHSPTQAGLMSHLR